MNQLEKLRSEEKEFFAFHEKAEKLIIKRLQDLGHVLKTHGDADKEWYEGTNHVPVPKPSDNDIDTFAYSDDTHNGPVCKICGDHWCIPCAAMNKWWPIKKCEGKQTSGEKIEQEIRSGMEQRFLPPSPM